MSERLIIGLTDGRLYALAPSIGERLRRLFRVRDKPPPLPPAVPMQSVRVWTPRASGIARRPGTRKVFESSGPVTSGARTYAVETRAYEIMRPSILDHEGEFALLVGARILGFFPTPSAARDEGFRRFGRHGHFFIQLVEAPGRERIDFIPTIWPS